MIDPKIVAFKNVSGETIPGYGVIRITAVTVTDGIVLLSGDKPSTTFAKEYAVNCAADCAADSWGSCYRSGDVLASYDTGTPANGEGWGPKPGQWTLSKGYPGFIVHGIVDATNKILLGSGGTITTLLGKASGAITARSGTTQGTGTMAIWYDNAGTLTDTTMTVTVKNLSATAVTASAYIQAKWIGNAFYVDYEDCG